MHDTKLRNGGNSSLEGTEAEHELMKGIQHDTVKYFSEPLNSSKSIVLQMDCIGDVVYINKFALDFFGYTEEEILGKSIIGTIVPEVETSGRNLQKMIDDLVQNIKHYSFNINENIRKGGERVWIAWTNKLVHKSNSGYDKILCIGTDITSLKDADDRCYHLMRDLSITNQDLSRKNDELGRFCYTISHDLRSPIITILALIDLLKNDLGERNIEQINADIEMIKTSAFMMDNLIKDTLELSRIGLVAAPSEQVPFGEIVDEALEYVNSELKSKEVKVSCAQGFPEVFVDRKKIVEVLINLINNSVKYGCSKAAPKVEIGFRSEGQDVVFYVKDNGLGIDSKHHQKIFDLFYKVNVTSEGTGAGLAIVKRIIEAHGGRIWVESEVGNGCTMCFTLSMKSNEIETPYKFSPR
jgi:PAS domain S-box-containing protein